MLERADRAFEGQALGLKHLCRGTAAIADDGGEHDGAIDLPPASTAGGSGGGFENAPQVERHAGLAALAGTAPLRQRGEKSRDFRLEPDPVDVARGEDEARVGVLAQGQQHVLEHNLAMTLAARKLPGARERAAQAGRHGNSAQVVGNHVRPLTDS
jgi:hypothetical protein